jgi:hypothetical protein
MLLMVPDNDCSRLLSIIGTRKTRKVCQSGLGADTEISLKTKAGWIAAATARDGVYGGGL